MNELNLFAEITLRHGGEWWQLEKSDDHTLCLCESKTKFVVNNRIHHNPPAFQIFDKKTGKRLFASTNYQHAYGEFQRLCKEG